MGSRARRASSDRASPAAHSLKDEPLRALGWMTLSGLGFSLMSLFIKQLIEQSGDAHQPFALLRTANRLPGFELVFFRSFINVILVLALIYWREGWTRHALFPRAERRLLIIRGLAGFSGLTCWFWALKWLPLSIASVLNWCAPLFTLLFSALFVGERTPLRKLVWVALSMVGLVLVLKLNPTDFADFHLPWIGVAIGLAGAASAGIAYSAVRVATASLTPETIVLYFVGIATLGSFPLALANWTWPSPVQWALIVFTGIAASGAQLAMTQAYRYAAAGIVSTMGLLSAAFTLLWGWVFLGEMLLVSQWLGIAILGISIGLLTVQRR